MVKSRDKNLLSLLYVCRQVYSETAFLPYKLNSFEICRDSPVSLVAFLKRRTTTQIELMQDVIRRWKYVKTRWERRWLFYRRMSAPEWVSCLSTRGDPSSVYWLDWEPGS